MYHPILEAVPNLERLVCDKSSFEALCESNHTIGSVCRYNNVSSGQYTDLGRAMMDLSPVLEKALHINNCAGISEETKVRAKLMNFYFKGEFDWSHLLIDLELPFLETLQGLKYV